MGRQRIWWAAAAVVAAVIAAAALSRPAGVRLSDLAVYLGATAGLEHGASLYDFIRGNAPFTYPPFAGLLLRPLTPLPTLPLQVAWSLATVATVAGLAVLVARSAGLAQRAGLLALVLMLSAPVSSDLKYGQASLFLAGLIVVDVLTLRRTRWAGALIGVAAAVKLTPLIFIPMLWLAGRRAAAVTATATFAGCAAIGAIHLPGDSWRFWTDEVFRVDRLGYITSAGNQSLNGALLRFQIGPDVRPVLVAVIGGAIAAIALWRAGRLARDGEWLAATIVAGAASVVLSPVSWTHHQIWLVLAVLLPVRGPGWARRAWTLVVLGVMLLPVTALGPPLWSNARLLLAIAVAVAVPAVGRTRAARPPSPTAAPRSRTPGAAHGERLGRLKHQDV
jgi:alpha-1,2-mannosyltransferase